MIGGGDVRSPVIIGHIIFEIADKARMCGGPPTLFQKKELSFKLYTCVCFVDEMKKVCFA